MRRQNDSFISIEIQFPWKYPVEPSRFKCMFFPLGDAYVLGYLGSLVSVLPVIKH